MIVRATQNPPVLLVTVDYGGSDATIQLIKSLNQVQHPENVFVIVVLNESSNGRSRLLRSRLEPWGNLKLIESPQNRGYFGGIKYGIKLYEKACGQLPNWVIACNNDIKIEQHNFFDVLGQLESKDVGVIAPRIVSCHTALNQNPFMIYRPGRWRITELRFWLRTYHLARLHTFLSRLKKRVGSKMRWLTRAQNAKCSKGPIKIYAAHGSFLIFHNNFFLRGGYLDDQFFLFSEEISVAEICVRIGLSIIYHPELTVFHDEHSTTDHQFTRTIYNYERKSFEHLMAQYLMDIV